MERKNGETFEFEGKKLKVVENNDNSGCEKCFFCNRECSSISDVRGFCSEVLRTDMKHVIFVKAKDEQPQEQTEQPHEEPQQLNLCEVLKHCPQGEPFWSPMFGDVTLYCTDQETKKVLVATEDDVNCVINADGTVTIYGVTSPEIMLYPSRKQRDWSKFTAPWYKKKRFDPKTLKSFDKVIFKGHGMWFCGLFSHIHNSYACVGETYYKCVIPYNDDTKHLVGTKDEAPEFYKYWED